MEGTRLGPYQLLAELGSGGMGKVYRAEVAGPVPGLDAGCAVALKVIHAHLLETPGFFKRFLREADLGRTIEHENVVRTYDCDALLHDGTQQNFLVMEYVEGQTLRDLLQELERVPEELCRHIGREVAKGLAAIHEAGVVHRDLKPENVLITPDHVVKIMDLGVARLQAEAVRLSMTGAFVGSLEYAAPEQFRSSDGEPDGRADLHALGVVLYELASGQHPYRDEDASRVIGRILDDTPRKAGELNPQLSPFFEEVVQTLIAKNRDERFGQASDLALVFDDGEKSDWWKERAKALRVETKRPLRRIRIARETALYGRDDDLAWMGNAYAKAQQGDGRVLLIEGEAGIGKTRLVDEFVGRLRQQGENVNFLFGSYPPGGAATASGAFSEAYREQLGGEGLEEVLAVYLTVTPLLVPAYAALLRGDACPKDAEPLTKHSLQTVFVHATRGLAAERTTIVLIDDLHFAPEDGRALFTSLALAAPEHRVLLIGTMRPGVPRAWTSGITRLDHGELRQLSRLGPKDLTRLLTDSFKSDRLARELAFQIAEKSDGNPFFAFEIIRGLREGQFLAQQPDGTWVTTRVIEDIQVPSSVLDLVNARVADLTDDERNFLDVASCMGFAFDFAVVADVVGLPRIPALQLLAKIEKRHRLVRSVGHGFEYDHHQVQEALYGALSGPLREAYHVSIAESLEVRAGARDGDLDDVDGGVCVALCEHFLAGGEGRRALRYVDAALDHLRTGYLNDQAVGLADRVLSIPDLVSGTDRIRLLLRMEGRLDRLGRRDVQEEVLSEARALAEETGEMALLARAEQRTGNLMWLTGRYETACEHFERNLAVAQETGDREAEAWASVGLGLVSHHLSRLDEAEAYLERARIVFREIGDRRGEGRATGNLGMVASARSQYDDAREQYEQWLSISREIGDRQGEATATGNLGNVLLNLGRYEEARLQLEQNISMAREIGDRQGEGRVCGNLGAVFFYLGRYDAAREQFENWLSIAREIGDRQSEGRALGNLGSVLATLGHYGAGRERFERSIAIAHEIGDRAAEVGGTANLGDVLRSLGLYEQAWGHFEDSLTIARDIGDRQGEGTATGNLGDLLRSFGQYASARDHLERYLAIAREIGDRRGEGRATGNLGAVFRALGEYDAAREQFEQWLSIARETGGRRGEAGALLGLARVLHEGGRPDDARSRYEEALALGREMDAPSTVIPASCNLAVLPGGDAAEALSAVEDYEDRADCAVRLEARFLLWRALGEVDHLTEAKRLLDYRVEHAPEEYRESMLKNVRLNREIMAAWEEHGGGDSGEAADPA